MKIFIGPVEIAGVARSLSKGFSEIGVEADVVLSVKHPFSYGGYIDSWLLRVWQFWGGLRASTPNCNFFKKLTFVLLHNLWGWFVFMWALFSYDAFVFLYARTMTDSALELFILKVFGKKVIFLNLGSDSRPPYMDGAISPWTKASPDFSRLASLTRKMKRRMRVIERFSDYIVSSPSTAQFYERPFVKWFSLGFSVSSAVNQSASLEKSERIKILHSPSNVIVKGSDKIYSAIDSLISRGYDIDLVKLEGVSNARVLDELQDCDFVVDQAYSDIPMAVFGGEAACFEKPCVIAGYMAKEMEGYFCEKDIPPSLYVVPDDLESAIERMICDVDFREGLGREARAFFRGHWSCAGVARRYLSLLEGRVPEEWLFDPREVSYVGGCGMPISYAGFLVDGLVERYGVDVLQVADKPVLQEKLLKLSSPQKSQAHA